MFLQINDGIRYYSTVATAKFYQYKTFEETQQTRGKGVHPFSQLALDGTPIA